MAKHHTVQKAYLNQWVDPTTNKFWIYVISENKYIEKNGSWTGFRKNNFNILDGLINKNIPEDFTADIDTHGIEVIREICKKERQLSDRERFDLACYIALQYIRTPRYREELDSMIDAAAKAYEKIRPLKEVEITREWLLEEALKDDNKKIIEKINELSDEEINSMKIDIKDVKIGLSKSGHSKSMMKNVPKLAKKVFDFKWIFLKSPEKSSFISSDNPCFVIPGNKFFSQGIGSHHALTIFPLSPELCICVDSDIKLKYEIFAILTKEQVRQINKEIVKNSYEGVIARDKTHLESLTKRFDYKNYKKKRAAITYKFNDYIVFNLE